MFRSSWVSMLSGPCYFFEDTKLIILMTFVYTQTIFSIQLKRYLLYFYFTAVTIPTVNSFNVHCLQHSVNEHVHVRHNQIFLKWTLRAKKWACANISSDKPAAGSQQAKFPKTETVQKPLTSFYFLSCCFNFFAQSVHVKLALPQAAWISIF